MFNEILHDLNRKLSQKGVHLFDSFNFDDKESRNKLKQYVNIAVFRINYGSLQLLEGNKGMTVEATLHFAFRAEENTLSPAKMENILDYLMQNNNGVISETSNGLAETEADPFRYVFTFDLYKPVGEMKALSYDDTPDRYVFYDLPVQIIISKALMFGDDFKIYFAVKDESGGFVNYVPLKNVIYWEETPVASFETPVFVNEGIQKNLFVARSWELKGQMILNTHDDLLAAIDYNAHVQPDFVYTIVYALCDRWYTAEVYFTVSHNGTVRKFVILDFSFKLYDDYREVLGEELAVLKEAILGYSEGE